MGVWLRIEKEEDGEKSKGEGMIKIKIILRQDWWRIVREYINNDLAKKVEKLKKWAEERVENTRVLIEKNFYARTEQNEGNQKS